MRPHLRAAGGDRNPVGGGNLDPRPSPAGVVVGEPDISSCSSSIGKNSERDSGSSVEDTEEKEVQSAYSGALGTMNALEESLPIRRGISNFYCGKSISFTSLADVVSSCSSAEDLTKPENAYTRKRRNLLALRNFCDRPHSNPLRSTGGGICKRPANPNRSTLALAAAFYSSGSSSTNLEEAYDRQWLFPPLNPPGKPAAGASPLGSSSPQKCTLPLRSFSLTDLQGITGCSSSTDHRDKHKGFS